MTGLLCLAAASVSDIRTKTVPDIIWWIMGAEALILMLLRPSELSPGPLFECLFVIFVQEHIMSRFYGMADSHAFSCCMLMMALRGIGLEGHIAHMTLSLVLLTASQAACRNIGRDGKLKNPVPFIPYISVSFLCIMALYGSAFRDCF